MNVIKRLLLFAYVLQPFDANSKLFWLARTAGILLLCSTACFAQNKPGASFEISGNAGWELSSTETSQEGTAHVFIDRIVYPKSIPGGRMPVIRLIATKSDPRNFVNAKGGTYKYYELFFGTGKVATRAGEAQSYDETMLTYNSTKNSCIEGEYWVCIILENEFDTLCAVAAVQKVVFTCSSGGGGSGGGNGGGGAGGGGGGGGLEPGTSSGNAKRFTSVPNDITVPLGGTIDLRVAWDGPGMALWYKDYLSFSDYDESGRRTLTYSPSRYSQTETRLVIQRAQASDAGDYWVTVANLTLADPGIATTKRIRVTVGGPGLPSGGPPLAPSPPAGRTEITITSPSNGAAFQAPASGLIRVNMSQFGQQLSTLELLLNGRSLTTALSPIPIPYEFSFSNLTPGSYTYTVKGKLLDGSFVESAPVTINVTAAPPPTPGQPPGGGWVLNPSNGHYYKVIENVQWVRAQQAAVSMGANLVTIRNTAENNWLAAQFGGPWRWIGLHDSNREGTWEWISGEPVTFTNWGPGEPNNGTDEDFGMTNFGTNGRWNDLKGNDGACSSAIIEWKPPPDAKADLTVTSITISPAIVEEGKAATVTAVIQNSGGGNAGATRARLSFSPQDDYNQSDDVRFEVLGNVSALAAGKSQTVRWDILMPNLGAGSYDFWPLVEVDVDGSVSESSDENLFKNRMAHKGKDAPVPDLQVGNVTVTAGTTVGGVAEETKNIIVRAEIKNGGQANAPPTRARLWLSPKDDWDTSDDFSSSTLISVPALAIGRSYTAQWTLAMPDLGSGNYDYFVVVQVDVDSSVVESDEGNLFKSNTMFKAKDAVPIKPDLIVSSITVAPSTAEEGKNVIVTAVVQNTGTANAGASRAALRFSPQDDYVYDDDASITTILNVSALAPSKTQTLRWTVPMPNVGTGTYDYWVLVTVDADELVAELNESNTFKVSQAFKAKDAPLPDLQVPERPTVTGLSPDGFAEEGKSFQIRAVIQNGGQVTAPATRARVWLSPKQDWEASDDFKSPNLISVPALAVGATYTALFTITMPDLGRGIYDFWLLTEVDADAVVLESNEDNRWLTRDPFKARDSMLDTIDWTPPGRTNTEDNNSVVNGDFNRDGAADILFQDASGSLATWFMDGEKYVSASMLSPSKVNDAKYRVVASADFNQDTHEDLLLQNADGTLQFWYMDGLKQTSNAVPTPASPGDRNWKAVAAADFNNDQKIDIVFQHTDGTLAAWFMDGLKLSRSMLFTPSRPGDAQWQVVGGADFNSDTKPDLLFQHTDGTLAVWYLNGTTLAEAAVTNPASAGSSQWGVVSVSDRNRDGRPDLLFQHVDGSLAVSVLNGVNLGPLRLLNPTKPGGTWKVVAP